MVNLLVHKNSYTGLTYAEDPAVGFVEIINEQSILFYTTMAPLKASPTLRTQVARRFSDWLRTQYGTQEKLAAAWGEKAFDGFENDGFAKVGERLDKTTSCRWAIPGTSIPPSSMPRSPSASGGCWIRCDFSTSSKTNSTTALSPPFARPDTPAKSSPQLASRPRDQPLLQPAPDWRIGPDRHNYFGGGDGSRINVPPCSGCRLGYA
jgi:hypothetical protein